MSLDDGWVSVYRSIMQKSYYLKSEYVHLWIHLILKANHKEKEILVDGKAVKIKRGEFITSRKKLAYETGIQESKVERILKFLKSEQQIEQQTTNHYRLIIIKNYEKYQKNEQQIEPHVNSKRTTSEHQVNTTNNDNKDNNNNKHTIECDLNKYFDEFWKLYPKKINKASAKKKYLQLIKKESPELILKATHGYMHFKLDEAREKEDDPKECFFKNPENFLTDEFFKEYVSYKRRRPPL